MCSKEKETLKPREAEFVCSKEKEDSKPKEEKSICHKEKSVCNNRNEPQKLLILPGGNAKMQQPEMRVIRKALVKKKKDSTSTGPPDQSPIMQCIA